MSLRTIRFYEFRGIVFEEYRFDVFYFCSAAVIKRLFKQLETYLN